MYPKRFYFFAIAFFALLGCEEEFIPEGTNQEPDLVVEGYIEAGEQALPPYVILTKSVPFFREFNADDLANTFVHDATITVSDGEKQVQLTELCLDELSAEQKALAAVLFGFDPDSVGFNFCIYLDLTFSMVGEVGKSYTLQVEAAGKTLHAVTTIPRHVPLDSIRFEEPPGEPNDTLAQLICYYRDPGFEANFYRYQVGINQGGLQSPLSSVTDDRFFDGQAILFPLAKPESATEDIDFETFGLYTVGDTIALKWCNLDEAHFNFWNTLEFNTANQGPFSSYTLIESNIQGGLGIWGGLSASYYEMVVNKQ
ncbi:MAG TPA: DUF4249 domain-containing protein [Saprospiraceae bacterium]|nr:DUF4249 domain-containing protein [Saprospiraceae bacterium]HMQ85334.1 DUF4249 domain-containing protein [Saprospiraceae bacterium]